MDQVDNDELEDAALAPPSALGTTMMPPRSIRRHSNGTFEQTAPGDPSLPQSAPKSKMGSLDFERVVNEYSIEATRERFLETRKEEEQRLLQGHDGSYATFARDRHRRWKRRPKPFLGYSGKAATRWVLSCATGLLTGLIAIFIVSCTDTFIEFRARRLDKSLHPVLLYFSYMLYNLSFALLSCLLCLKFAPDAIGSGIPEINAYLNGVRVRRFQSFKLFLVKVVATVFSMSSGLTLGPEGPLVHIGAIFGGALTKIGPLLQGFGWFPAWAAQDLSHFCTDGERRDLISIAAAAGFAAAFGAPIGGLLFSIEEISTFYEHSLLFKTLAATAIATLCLAILHGDLSEYSIINLGNSQTAEDQIFLNRFEELPLYMLVGAVGGALGGIFCLTWNYIQKYRISSRKDLSPNKIMFYQVREVALVSILTSTLLFVLPFASWACKVVDPTDDLVLDIDHTFHCPPGQANRLSSILFGSRENAITQILTDPNEFDPKTLLVVGCLFFGLMTLTMGVALPSGIFMPTVLIGCSFGGYFGLMLQDWFGDVIAPSTFALLGAAALLAGVQRSTVSLCVILVEGTGQVKVLIPVILTVVVARYVGDRFTNNGLYEIAMEINEYPYLDHHEQKTLDMLKVSDIMSPDPVTFGTIEVAENIQRKLRESNHHGFPVVDKDTKRFLGLVRRDQLVALLECDIFLNDDEITTLSSSSFEASPRWRHKADQPGMSSSSLMTKAYHIRDDRYDKVIFQELDETADEFDEHAWLLDTIRASNFEGGDDNVVDEALPPLQTNAESETRVGLSRSGTLVVKLDKRAARKHVNIGAVMNRGTYCVTADSPVSMAHYLFTNLGLRHLIVLGGPSGGEVVGLLTRSNLVKDFMEERASGPLE